MKYCTNILSLLGLFIIFSSPCFAQKAPTTIIVKEDPKIERIIQQLFNAYQYKNFQNFLPYTIGNFKDFIINILSYQSDNHGQIPNGIENFISHLKKYKILGQAILGNKAVVHMQWVLLYSKPNPYFKLISIEYHLVKNKNQWKIIDSKNKGENYLTIR